MLNDYFRSSRLLYRPFQEEDLPTLVKWANEATRRRWFYFQEPACLTAAFWAKDIEKGMKMWVRRVNILEEEAGLGIVSKRNGELVGYVGLGKTRCDDVEIGYSIGEAHQNKGYATEAVKAAVTWGFKQLRAVDAELKIVAKVEHENGPSRKVLEKAGFLFSHAEKYVSVYEIKGQ